MNNPRITQRVKEIVADKVNSTYEEIDVRRDLRNDLGMESLDVIELVLDLQKEYNFHIPDQMCEKWKTVQDAIDTINELKQEKSY